MTPRQDQRFDSLNASTAYIANYLLGKTLEINPSEFPWVDVRDLAQVHVRALTTPGAGERIVVSSGSSFNAQAINDILRKNFPEYAEKIPVGQPGVVAHEGIHFFADNTKVKKLMGTEFRSLEECLVGKHPLQRVRRPDAECPAVDTAKSIIELQKRATA